MALGVFVFAATYHAKSVSERVDVQVWEEFARMDPFAGGALKGGGGIRFQCPFAEAKIIPAPDFSELSPFCALEVP